MRLLHNLYPGGRTSANAAGYVGALEPDLLGEAMVLRTLKAESASRRPLLDVVFEGAGEDGLRTGFTVLERLSEEHEEEARGWIARVLDGDVPGRAVAALEAAKAVGQRTAYSSLGVQLAEALGRKGTSELAVRLEAAGIPEDTVLLREVAVWVMSTLLAHLPERAEPQLQAQRAGLLNSLGMRQSALGHWEAALASTQEAVEQFRKLAGAQPDALLPDLAASLNNLGGRQSALGQREAALASAQEAVEQYRKLAAARPDTFLPNLATSSAIWAGCKANWGNGSRRWPARKRRSTSAVSLRLPTVMRSCGTLRRPLPTWACCKVSLSNERRR